MVGLNPMSPTENLAELKQQLHLTHVRWAECWYIIPKRFPKQEPFQRIVEEGDIEMVREIEALSNQHQREQQGRIRILPRQDHITGPYHPALLSALTLGGSNESLFSSDQQGVLYTAQELQCCIEETSIHLSHFLSATKEAAIEVDFCAYRLGLDAEFYDFRGIRKQYPQLFNTDDHLGTRALAKLLREQGAYGLLFESVHQENCDCAAVFRPQAFTQCVEQQHLCFVWDGDTVQDIYEKRSLDLSEPH